MFYLPRLCRTMSFLLIFDRPNDIGEINLLLRRVVLQICNSLLVIEGDSTLKCMLFVYNINSFFSSDWEKHAHTPCVQIHKVINKYSMIADGLSTLSNSMRNVRENYQATKRTMQQGVDNLANDVRYTGRL